VLGERILKRIVGKLPAKYQWELMSSSGHNVPDIDTEEERKEGKQEANKILDRVEDYNSNFTAGEAKVLEIGCGYGRLIVPVAQRVNEAYGVDISKSSIRKANKYATSEQVDVQFATAEESVPFDETFDLIYSKAVFMHMRRRQMLRYLKSVYDHLDENGVVYLDVPSLETGINDLVNEELGQRYEYRMRYYTQTELELYLEATGYENVEVRETGGYRDGNTIISRRQPVGIHPE